ncbi:MAG: hypothetical protein IPK99_15275 [Flavobacteriales bacterium]|nr:hypothetical protein [Flavobacteriales bacterium]
MRTTLLSLAIASFVLTSTRSTAQCPGCQTDLACQVSPAYPTLCPAAPPAATAGVYYETDLTFWLPTTFDDPGTGLTVDFLQMTITSIAGIPFGLAIETSDPLGVYDPSKVNSGARASAALRSALAPTRSPSAFSPQWNSADLRWMFRRPFP